MCLAQISSILPHMVAGCGEARGRRREGDEWGREVFVPLLSLQGSVPDNVLLLLNCRSAAVTTDPVCLL